MRSHLKYVGGLFVLGLILSASAGARADTLTEALVKAYNTNPDLAAAQAQLREVDELAPQALSGYRPTVSATATAGAAALTTHAADRYDTLNRSVGLQMQQPLYRGGRTGAAVREADSRIAAQRALLQSTEQTVLLQGIQTYLDVMRDEATVGITKENEQVLQKELKGSDDRFAVGEVTRTDVSQSKARVAGANALRVQAEGFFANSLAAYQRIFGEAPTGLVKPDTTGMDLPISLEEAVETALKGNPRLIAAEQTRAAAKAALDSVRGERLPTLSALASVEHSHADGDPAFANDWSDGATARLSLNVPLYQAGAVSSRIREARHTVTRRDEERDSAQRQVVEQVTSAWQALETAKAARTSRLSQVDASRVALDGVKQEALVGSRSVLDTLNAEQEYLDARIGLLRAERDEIYARYALLASMGQLTAQDLKLPVEYYDDTAYARHVRGKWIGSGIE